MANNGKFDSAIIFKVKKNGSMLLTKESWFE